MKKFVVKLEMWVDESWIADGFDVSKEGLEAIEGLVQHRLPYAYGFEFKVRASVISAPSDSEIKKLQGYSFEKLVAKDKNYERKNKL